MCADFGGFPFRVEVHVRRTEPRPETPVNSKLLALLVVLHLSGCVSRTITEVGGDGTAWVATPSPAALAADQDALSIAMTNALDSLPSTTFVACKGKQTRIRSVAVDGVSETMVSFATHVLARRLGDLGCKPTEDQTSEATVSLLIHSWGWDVSSLEQTRTTTQQFMFLTAASQQVITDARIRSVANVTVTVASSESFNSGDANGASAWRVISGENATVWPVATLPLVDAPPPRVITRKPRAEQ